MRELKDERSDFSDEQKGRIGKFQQNRYLRCDFRLQLKLMKSIRLGWIIHIFALLHAVVVLSCRSAGIDDELLLTVLTMALSLIICMKQGLKIEFTAAIIIVTNILGFLIGTLGATFLQSFIHSTNAVHGISTVITTEILGWCIFAITNIFGQGEAKKEKTTSAPYLKWVLLVAAVIFILRLVIVFFLSRSQLEQDVMLDIIRRVMTNSFSLIILACVNIMFIRSVSAKGKPSSRFGIAFLYTVFMLLAALLETFLVGIDEESFILIFMIALIVQVTMYCLVYIINYTITVRHEMQTEREKANMAQYRYLKLKRQVNPHFLFNSLNILDCLICEEKTVQASTYTHKLAGIYRYMIKSEDEEIVPLRDEIDFVKRYTDLLKVRFQEGFEVEIDIPEDAMARFVPPCSIQLLIENATKHNSVSPERPLTVRVKVEDGHVRVSNNVIPKVTKSPSTGLGQQYIRQLYMDLSGKSIEIVQTADEYCVTLPLL